jgi:hypothetical protein
MKIINDQISFDVADFDALSDFAKAALPPYSGTTPFLVTFANGINEHIRTAKAIAKQNAAASPKVDAVIEGLAEADALDPQKRADAETCLDQLVVVLGVDAKAAANVADADAVLVKP